jgi:phosphopantetheinyl transferase (holo-ACP synthase)
MKIFGIGIDIVQNKRIEQVLLKPTALRFVTRMLHSDEIKQLELIKI